MSEGKEGAHPPKQKSNLAGIGYSGEEGSLPPLRRRGKVRGPGMSGTELLFDSPQVSAPNVIEPIVAVQTELEPRKIKFIEGTKLYRVIREDEGRIKIPRTPVDYDKLFDRKLSVATYLDVPVEFLEIGVRGGTITKKVGQSVYGAFTVVLFPVRYSRGEVVMEERLASYLTRSSNKRK